MKWLMPLFCITTLFAAPIRISEVKKEEKLADPIQQLAGVHSLGAQTFEKIISSGLLKLNRTTITQTLRVEGSLVAQSAHLNTLDVMGEATISDSIVAGTAAVTGSLRTQGTTFEGPLTLSGQKTSFSGSKLAAVTVRKDASFKGKQILELKQRTLAEGPIVFESGKGEVHVYPGSQVIGKVTGGKVVRKG